MKQRLFDLDHLEARPANTHAGLKRLARPPHRKCQQHAKRFAFILGVIALANLGWNDIMPQDYMDTPALAVELASSPADNAGKPPITSGPIVHEPVAPSVQEKDLRSLPPAKRRKPGGPVKERKDLQRSDGQPK